MRKRSTTIDAENEADYMQIMRSQDQAETKAKTFKMIHTNRHFSFNTTRDINVPEEMGFAANSTYQVTIIIYLR